MFVLVNPRRSKDDITHLGTAPAQGPQTVVRHVVAGGDVDLPELVAVPGRVVHLDVEECYIIGPFRAWKPTILMP